MSRDKQEFASMDASYIELTEPWEVDYWTATLGVTEERLRHAIAEVGRVPAEVRRYLAREASLGSSSPH